MADTKEEKEKLSRLFADAAIVERERWEIFAEDMLQRENPKAAAPKTPAPSKP
jgi:hypothetical protein